MLHVVHYAKIIDEFQPIDTFYVIVMTRKDKGNAIVQWINCFWNSRSVIAIYNLRIYT